MTIFLLFFLIIPSCNKKDEVLPYNYQNLSDQEKSQKAIEISEAKWNEIYGKENMSNEKPLKAKKINDSILYVEGTFNSIGFGGVAFGEVKNKKVIKYSHGK